MIDDRTSKLNLALPNIANNLSDDVGRIRTTISDIANYVSNGRVALTGDANIYVGQTKEWKISNHNALSTYSISVSAGSAGVSGDTVTLTAPGSAQTLTITVTMDGLPTTMSMTVLGDAVLTPTNASPSNGSNGNQQSVSMSSSAFAYVGSADTHLNSDWQLATNSNFTTVVQSTSADTSNKVSWVASNLAASTTYYFRVRHRGASGRVSAWSSGTSFSTAVVFSGSIGTPGGVGFGVSSYVGTLPSGFTAMTGSSDPTHDNYGNYQFSDNSVMVWIPRFYYRIGSNQSPRWAVYGNNAIDIAGMDQFATEAAANSSGYAMHRAFIDGGAHKNGFFIDKYLCSKYLSKASSFKNSAQYHLANSTGARPYDAFTLSRARGSGFNCASIFMYSALAFLSLAHAEASTSTTYCAWYDATYNFPKGPSNTTSDYNDGSANWQVDGYYNKPMTGSCSNLAKSTHNGRNCGVADLASFPQVAIGATTPSTGISASNISDNNNPWWYVLKTSVSLANLEGTWAASVNSAFGNTTGTYNINDNYEYSFTDGFIGSVGTKLGNSTNAVFSNALSGENWLRTCCLLPSSSAGTSATGTNLFGTDQVGSHFQLYNMIPIAGMAQPFGSGAYSGIFSLYRGVGANNTNVNDVYFRAACY